MSDRVAVSNLALAQLGETDKLTDPLDDSKAAASIASVWDDVRDATLRDHLWNFAMWWEALSAVDQPGRFGFAYGFQLPADFLRLDLGAIEPDSVRGAHKLAGGFLWADDIGPISVPYVRRIADVGLWDATFVGAFACHLAWHIADDITGDAARKAAAWDAYQLKLKQAKGIDGRENPPEAPIDTSWATARYDAGAGGYRGWGYNGPY